MADDDDAQDYFAVGALCRPLSGAEIKFRHEIITLTVASFYRAQLRLLGGGVTC